MKIFETRWTWNGVGYNWYYYNNIYYRSFSEIVRSLLEDVLRISKFLPKSENSLEKKFSEYSRSCIFVWVSTLLSKKQNSVSSTIIWLQCSFCDNLCKTFDTKYSLSILATVLCSTITALERGRRQRNDLILPAPKISYVHIWCRSVPCGR